MTELPPLAICLQEASEGASAATFSTQEVTAIAPIASSTKTLPKTSRSLAPIPPCGRRRRRLRCVITQRVLRAPPGSGRFLFDRVGGRKVVDLAFDQELVGDHDRAA